MNDRPRDYSVRRCDMMFSRLSLALDKEQLEINCKYLIHTSCRSESSFMCLCRLDNNVMHFQTISLLPRCNFVWFFCPTLSKEEILNACQHNIWDELASMMAYNILSLMRHGKIDNVLRTKNLTDDRVGFL